MACTSPSPQFPMDPNKDIESKEKEIVRLMRIAEKDRRDSMGSMHKIAKFRSQILQLAEDFYKDNPSELQQLYNRCSTIFTHDASPSLGESECLLTNNIPSLSLSSHSLMTPSTSSNLLPTPRVSNTSLLTQSDPNPSDLHSQSLSPDISTDSSYDVKLSKSHTSPQLSSVESNYSWTPSISPLSKTPNSNTNTSTNTNTNPNPNPNQPPSNRFSHFFSHHRSPSVRSAPLGCDFTKVPLSKEQPQTSSLPAFSTANTTSPSPMSLHHSPSLLYQLQLKGDELWRVQQRALAESQRTTALCNKAIEFQNCLTTETERCEKLIKAVNEEINSKEKEIVRQLKVAERHRLDAMNNWNVLGQLRRTAEGILRLKMGLLPNTNLFPPHNLGVASNMRMNDPSIKSPRPRRARTTLAPSSSIPAVPPRSSAVTPHSPTSTRRVTFDGNIVLDPTVQQTTRFSSELNNNNSGSNNSNNNNNSSNIKNNNGNKITNSAFSSNSKIVPQNLKFSLDSNEDSDGHEPVDLQKLLWDLSEWTQILSSEGSLSVPHPPVDVSLHTSPSNTSSSSDDTTGSSPLQSPRTTLRRQLEEAQRENKSKVDELERVTRISKVEGEHTRALREKVEEVRQALLQEMSHIHYEFVQRVNMVKKKQEAINKVAARAERERSRTMVLCSEIERINKILCEGAVSQAPKTKKSKSFLGFGEKMDNESMDPDFIFDSQSLGELREYALGNNNLSTPLDLCALPSTRHPHPFATPVGSCSTTCNLYQQKMIDISLLDRERAKKEEELQIVKKIAEAETCRYKLIKDKLFELQTEFQCRWNGEIEIEKAPEELRRHIYKCCHCSAPSQSVPQAI